MGRWGPSVIVLIALAVVGVLFVKDATTGGDSLHFADYRAYANGAAAVRDQERLYGPALRWRDSGFTPFHPTKRNPTPGSGPYVYPPVLAAALVPLTILPVATQTILWLGVLYSCMLGTGYVLSNHLLSIAPRYRHAGALGLAVVLLFFGPIRLDLYVGQIEPMLLLLLSLALAGFLSRRDTAAGLWLGLAVAIKPLLGPLMLFFLWKRAYRAVAVTGAVLAAAGLVSLPLLGSDGVADYLAVLQYWSSPDHLVTPINQSIYGFLLRLLMANPFTVPLSDAPWLARLLHGLAVLGSLPLLALAISRSRAKPSQQQALEYGLVCIALLLVTPFAEIIHFGIVAIALLAVASAVASVLVRSRQQRWNEVHAESSAAVVVRAERVGRLLPGALLLLLVLAVYAYISLPRTLLLMIGDFAFYQRPLTMPTVLLTGVFLYALGALGGLVLLTLSWYRQATVTAEGLPGAAEADVVVAAGGGAREALAAVGRAEGLEA